MKKEAFLLLLLDLQTILLGLALAVCPTPPACVCFERSTTELVLNCNGVSVFDVTEELRANGSEQNFVEL